MNKERIGYLLAKYVDSELTAEERKEMVALLEKDDRGYVLELLQKAMEDEPIADELSVEERRQRARILEKVLAVDRIGHTGFERPLASNNNFFTVRKWLAAASVVLALCFGVLYLWKVQRSEGRVKQLVSAVDASKPTDYVRHLTLPDGSTVVLQAGSTLDYPQTFASDSRQVRLEGEAYFDIVHSLDSSAGEVDKIPFIIHTGKIRTVVLGTAFTIKAYPEQKNVVVSVTRGKVRVEDEQKVLAILTPDQQITYNNKGTFASIAHVDAVRTVDWAKADMEFDGVSFEKIAHTIEKRYGVEIVFENPDLKSCLIVSSFSGTETLVNVLETLCTVGNASFRAETAKKFVVDGSGCQ